VIRREKHKVQVYFIQYTHDRPEKLLTLPLSCRTLKRQTNVARPLSLSDIEAIQGASRVLEHEVVLVSEV
jgi:hypothetical protein